MIIMSASTNSPIWAKMFIKWDRFLGKFKKGPPHIGEYDKSDILENSNKVWLTVRTPEHTI